MIRIFIVILFISVDLHAVALAAAQKEIPRAIISDDFTKNRPKPQKHKTRRRSRTYRLATTLPAGLTGGLTVQVGVTVWKLHYVPVARSPWKAKRVEADTEFQSGEFLRLSIESPRPGYLYVINRDWFDNGDSGETNLIFPLRSDDNRVQAGKLIDIPAQHLNPFKTDPKPNQTGELLTIIVSSSPLPLPVSDEPVPVSTAQLEEWEGLWGGLAARYEMNGGAGETRTTQERQAADRTRPRQLTRDDPGPQTIFFLAPRRDDGLFFNLLLSYVK
jgi:hypothetical protein